MSALSEAQRGILELAGQGELEVSNAHPVVLGLEVLGLMEMGARIMSGGGILFSRSAKITDAGRAAIAKAQPPSGQSGEG